MASILFEYENKATKQYRGVSSIVTFMRNLLPMQS
ncbi:Uncharacterised protein [Vibrio parahaemolyticus]|nr:Uncharacterised protein [Vibrio parahaemolyticus]